MEKNNSTTATITTTAASSAAPSNNNSSNINKKNRLEAREQVALAWQQRRQQQEQNGKGITAGTTSSVIKNNNKGNYKVQQNAKTTATSAAKPKNITVTCGGNIKVTNCINNNNNSSNSGKTNYVIATKPKKIPLTAAQQQQQQAAQSNASRTNSPTTLLKLDSNEFSNKANHGNHNNTRRNWFFSALGTLAQNANSIQRCKQPQQPKSSSAGMAAVVKKPIRSSTTGTNKAARSGGGRGNGGASTGGHRGGSIQMQPQQPGSTETAATTAATNPTEPPRASRSFESKSSFPSVLALHQASALSRQIETLLRRNDEDPSEMEDDEEEEENGDETKDNNKDNEESGGRVKPTTAEKKQRNEEDNTDQLLAILSNQYTLDKAVHEMAQTRSRAFWLIDLRTVVDRLVEWKRQYASVPRRTTSPLPHATATSAPATLPAVRFLFRVSANSHPVLLRVLTCCFAEEPNQVQLVTGNAWDFTQVAKFCKTTTATTPSVARKTTPRPDATTATTSYLSVVDDSTILGKPDAYLRRSLLPPTTSTTTTTTSVEDNPKNNKASTKKSSTRLQQQQPKISCIAVDGPVEVHRIWNSLQRTCARRGRSHLPSGRGKEEKTADNNNLTLDVCLRFLPGSNPNGWSKLWNETQAALTALDASGASKIAAISLDVHDLLSASDDNNHNNPEEKQETAVLNPAILQALSTCLENIQSDQDKVRLELTGRVEPENAQRMEFLSVLMSSEQRLVSKLKEICVDITAPLLSSAGALCTRVIGVREQMVLEKNHTNSTTTTTAEDEKEEEHWRRRLHYYIDDGCYGSLYQEGDGSSSSSTQQALNPVPLITTDRTNTNNNNAAGAENEENSHDGGGGESFVSTVWGPTCDGLDRVCSGIQLPELRRDDWLVFPIQFSGEGLGTAFNGFCPPDTAYCVLGYFRD